MSDERKTGLGDTFLDADLKDFLKNDVKSDDFRDIFEEDYLIVMEDGYYEYIRGEATEGQTFRIEKVLKEKPEQYAIVKRDVEYERIHGKGSSMMCSDAQNDLFLEKLNEFKKR